jgi:hypothetical protein
MHLQSKMQESGGKSDSLPQLRVMPGFVLSATPLLFFPGFDYSTAVPINKILILPG